ncbi:hypothetical protein HX096_00320 [Empedobacter falsenii]|uniref:hypothetical protein n=1 Tax=Empedobacter falsenii TaxID=343874 RepID=UPI002576FFBF|nr:hypothetical protein [Empedobacter falsenii]MDM1546310.1 hypothetical protein [Empedobacter falsenii]
MTKLFYLFILFAISVNAQIVNLKIADLSDNLPLDDADIYFKNSTKNFVSDHQGKAMIDLSNISKTDELIVSKKDYQDAIIKVSELKSELSIKLEKVSEVELKEAFVTNLKVEDILQKVIDNYDKNFNTEQHFYKVNFIIDEIVDSTKRDFIDLDLQLRFKKDNLSIKSNNQVKERIINEPNYGYKINLLPILGMVSLKEVVNDYLKYYKKYKPSKVNLTKYGDELMYEFYLDNNSFHRFLVAKDSFAIVEYKVDAEGIEIKKSQQTVNFVNTYYRYRPYQGKYILKELMRNWSTDYKGGDGSNHNVNVKMNLEVKDFSTQPFPEFNKSVNEKMDIRRSFK